MYLDKRKDGTVVDTKAMIIGSRTYVPLRFISEAMGCDVGYTQAGNTLNVYIATEGKVVVPETPVKQSAITNARPPVSYDPRQEILNIKQIVPEAAIAPAIGAKGDWLVFRLDGDYSNRYGDVMVTVSDDSPPCFKITTEWEIRFDPQVSEIVKVFVERYGGNASDEIYKEYQKYAEGSKGAEGHRSIELPNNGLCVVTKWLCLGDYGTITVDFYYSSKIQP